MKRQLKHEELVCSIQSMVDHWPTWVLRFLAILIPDYYLQLGVKIVDIREDMDRRLKALTEEKKSK